MSRQSRLAKLEQQHAPTGPPVWLVFVDAEGRILDDGGPEAAPYVGMHFRDVPGGVGKIIGGVDPLEVLGRGPYLKKPREARP